MSGIVTLDDEPLGGAIVTFQPTGEGRASQATTAKDGSYTLVYSSHDLGAIVGKHKVTVTNPPPSDDTMDLQSKAIPAKYNTATELTKEVNPGENHIDLKLSSS